MIARRLPTTFASMLMALLAVVMLARPAAAEAPESAVSDDTALMVWLDLTLLDEDMIDEVGEMLGGLMDSPMLQGQSLPLGDLDMGILQLQDFRESFVEAGGEGILLMIAMPEGGLEEMDGMPPITAMVKVTSEADVEGLQDAIAGMADGADVEIAQYNDGWMVVAFDGSVAPPTEGDAEVAARFNTHLAERAAAPLTVVYRMDDSARDMIESMMDVEDAQMAMIAGIIQPLRGMDTAAVSIFKTTASIKIDIALAFEDSEEGMQFLNSFNGMMMFGQGILGMQMAEMENAPGEDVISGFFKHLSMQSDDNGSTLRIKLGEEFFGFAEEMAPALQELMGDMQGAGGAF